MEGGYRFQHHRKNVQDDQDDDKDVYDLIPTFVSDHFWMKQAVDPVFGTLIHRSAILPLGALYSLP
jgi:hypothetical protein